MNAGKAVFLSKPKADAFVANNGLVDTHEVAQQSKAFRVQVKAAQPSTAIAPQQAQTVTQEQSTPPRIDLAGDVPNASQQAAADELARRRQDTQAQRNAAPAATKFGLDMVDANNGRVVDPGQGSLLDGAAQPASATRSQTDAQQATPAKPKAGVVSATPSTSPAPKVGRNSTDTDTERQLKETERAYGGRPAYNRAKESGKTKLTYSQWVQVRTPNFKAWFGYDWEQSNGQGEADTTRQGATDSGIDRRAAGTNAGGGIAVRQKWELDRITGEPVVWQHGTKDEFFTFDLNHPNRKDVGWLGNGVYVTDSVDLAEIYANNKRGGGSKNLMSLFAAVRNPYIASPSLKSRLSMATKGQVRELTESLKDAGYDGVVLQIAEDAVELVVFDNTKVKSATGNNGNFDPANPDIRFSRTDTPPPPVRGIPAKARMAMFNRLARGIASRWANAPKIVVATNMDDPAIPKFAREADAKQRYNGASGHVEGFWHEGTVYVLTDNLQSAADFVRVFLHESLGHHGLRGVFGPKLDAILSKVIELRRDDVLAKAEQYGLDPNNEADLKEAAEEVLATMAQDTPTLGFVRRAVAAIRTWLRNHVPMMDALALTDEEIINSFILPARGFVERGRVNNAAAGQLQFNRADNAAHANDTDPGQADDSPDTRRAIDDLQRGLDESYQSESVIQGWTSRGILGVTPIANAFGTTVIGYKVRPEKAVFDVKGLATSNGLRYLGKTFLNVSTN